MAIYQFEYHTFLHHSQTSFSSWITSSSFEYHTFLHHSQTSNLKMNCFHLHKTGTKHPMDINRHHIHLCQLYNIL